MGVVKTTTLKAAGGIPAVVQNDYLNKVAASQVNYNTLLGTAQTLITAAQKTSRQTLTLSSEDETLQVEVSRLQEVRKQIQKDIAAIKNSDLMKTPAAIDYKRLQLEFERAAWALWLPTIEGQMLVPVGTDSLLANFFREIIWDQETDYRIVKTYRDIGDPVEKRLEKIGVAKEAQMTSFESSDLSNLVTNSKDQERHRLVQWAKEYQQGKHPRYKIDGFFGK